MFQCSDGNSAQENSSLKRVAVVEDFFDIIYAMHVEMGADPGRAPKHAGQKKTYKAVSFQVLEAAQQPVAAVCCVVFPLCCHQLAGGVFTGSVSQPDNEDNQITQRLQNQKKRAPPSHASNPRELQNRCL